MRTYESKGSYKKARRDDSLSIELAILEAIKKSETDVKAGLILSLTDVAQIVNCEIDTPIRNDKIKSLLIKYYGKSISFVKPSQKILSELFYYNDSLSKIIEKIYKHKCVVECANKLKKSIENIDFQLKDRFHDEFELRSSWEGIDIPPPFKLFFCTFFNIKKEEMNEKTPYIDNFDDFECGKPKKNLKKLRMMALFQIMCYLKFNGTKKTPLHVLVGLQIWTRTKSKTLTEIFNHLGLSICYDDNLRIRTRLANFAKECGINGVILPIRFNPELLTTAAFDNLDFKDSGLSGDQSVHDTKIVLFQDKDPHNQRKKPSLSEANISSEDRSFHSLLKCQELKEYTVKSTTVKLPENYKLHSDLETFHTNEYCNISQKIDFAWAISQLNISESGNMEVKNDHQYIPSRSAFNSLLLDDDRKEQEIGFLPVIPHPVTEYATVYTCMCIFSDLAKQLTNLPVTCDYGVYHMAKQIQLENPGKFDNIILLLGGFYTIKVIQGCIGKYLKHSGVYEIFTQTRLFGLGTVEKVLSGSHYAKSVSGFSFLYEALLRLQLKAFFTSQNVNKYFDEISSIILLRESILLKNIKDAKFELQEYTKNCSDMLRAFHDFVEKGCVESEMFKYWNNVLIMISIMQDFIRADRTGDVPLHISTFKKALPLFHIMDRVNYTRWGPVYLNALLTMKETSPDFYDEILKGRLSVKQNLISFTSVSTDQALEQTINKSSKSIAGIKGNIKNKESTTAWELTYHEFLGISEFFKEITFVNGEIEDVKVHHEYSNSHTQQSEEPVIKILNFILERNINPFILEPQPLKNIVTGRLVHSEIAKKILQIFNNAVHTHEKLLNERFVEKKKPVSAIIKENKFPSFETLPKITKPKIAKDKNQPEKYVQRYINIASARGYPVEKLLKYDLINANPLFDNNGLLMQADGKSSLIREIEESEKISKMFHSEDYVNFAYNENNTNLIIDVMLILRGIKWTNLVTFKDLAENFCQRVLHKTTLQNITRIDFVLDSYFPSSPKSSKHMLRCKVQTIPYTNINELVNLPKLENKDQFWGSSNNKIELQIFLKQYVLKHEKFKDYDIIFSTVGDGISNCPCSTSTLNRTLESIQILQRFDVEEADVKIIIHTQHAIFEGYKNVYIISSDTDVIVLLLFFWEHFKMQGL